MSLRKKIEADPRVDEFGNHDDSVPDYKYYVWLKTAYWHPLYMGRYRSSNTLEGILDYINGAVDYVQKLGDRNE